MSTVNYPLFELMSREHGLTLLETELQEIIQVCRNIPQAIPPANDPARETPTQFATEIHDSEIFLLYGDLQAGVLFPQAGFTVGQISESVKRLNSQVSLERDLTREVDLNDKMAKQRVPINNDDVREFVLMALGQHTLLNSSEKRDCADQILTAFAPACEELRHSVSELMDALAAKEEALKHVGGVLNKNGDWDDGCFYYNRVSAPELQGCLVVIESALAARTSGKDDKGEK